MATLVFQTALLRFDQSPIWGFHFMVPIDIAKQYITKKDRRVICELNNSHIHHCALMPDGNGEYFIMLNKQVKKKLDLVLGDKISVSIQKDKSKYGMPMPSELGELLQLDELADKFFHALTPGKQRNLIHLVSKYKNYETRINKAIVIVGYLKNAQGKLDFKDLNQAFKNHKPI